MHTSDDVKKSYPLFYKYVKRKLDNARWDKQVWEAFRKHSGLSQSAALEAVRYGGQPYLRVADLGKANGVFSTSVPNQITIDRSVVEHFEKDTDSWQDTKEKVAAIRLAQSTLLHELCHWADFAKDGKLDREDPHGSKICSLGKAFERDAYGTDVGRYWV